MTPYLAPQPTRVRGPVDPAAVRYERRRLLDVVQRGVDRAFDWLDRHLDRISAYACAVAIACCAILIFANIIRFLVTK